jgi:hypothetical protein
MVPLEYFGFYAACAAAGGALVGLLFVAIAIAPEHIVMEDAPMPRRAVSGGAFNALLNAFFISLGALLPHLNLGYIALPMSLVGLINSLIISVNLLRERMDWKNKLRWIWMIVISVLLYSTELVFAVLLLNAPFSTISVFVMGLLLMGIYAIGLIRAWELLGARRYGLLGWLNPLYDVKSTNSLLQKNDSLPARRK